MNPSQPPDKGAPSPGDMQRSDAAVSAYFRACHGRVDGFVATYFRYPGAWDTNRRTLGMDLLRAPLNLAWAPFFVAGQLLAVVAARAGATSVAARLAATPPGLPTQVQRYVQSRIEAELLDLKGQGNSPDAVPELPHGLRRETLDHYASTRTASADIANSVTSTVIGAFALKQFTPGGIAVGLVLAGSLAQARASRDFWLGETLGRLWYALVPAVPGTADTLLALALTLTGLAALASLSGLVLDPLQARLGIHQRRLHRMLDAVERELREQQGHRYRPADPLMARLLDAVDAIRVTLPFG